MEEITFQVKGSSADAYDVLFIKDGDSLTAICTCPAGQFGNLCKHRMSIIDGKADAVVSDNKDQVPKIADWLKGTDVEAGIFELRTAEMHKATPKDEIMALKRKVARAMNN